jgi:hypothetical protein
MEAVIHGHRNLRTNFPRANRAYRDNFSVLDYGRGKGREFIPAEERL